MEKTNRQQHQQQQQQTKPRVSASVLGTSSVEKEKEDPTPPQSSTQPPRKRSQSDAAALGNGSASPKGMNSSLQTTLIDEHLSPQQFGVVPELRLIITCGHWDHSFRLTSIDTGRLVQSISLHSDVITCLAIAKDFGHYWLVTGSRDCTIMVWEISTTDRDSPIGQTPLHILYGHDENINSVAVNAELNIIVSGSDDGTVMVFNLRDGLYIRSITEGFQNRGPSSTLGVPSLQASSMSSSLSSGSLTSASSTSSASSTPPQFPVAAAIPPQQQQQQNTQCHRRVTWVAVSKEGYILTYSADERILSSYSINGTLIASKTIPERLLAFLVSEDGLVLITGGDSCLVTFRWVRHSAHTFSHMSHVWWYI
jgi:WD40 repeat protein